MLGLQQNKSVLQNPVILCVASWWFLKAMCARCSKYTKYFPMFLSTTASLYNTYVFLLHYPQILRSLGQKAPEFWLKTQWITVQKLQWFILAENVHY